MPIIRLFGVTDTAAYLTVLNDNQTPAGPVFGPFDEEGLELQLTKIQLHPSEIYTLMTEYKRSSKAELTVPTVWGRSTFEDEKP